MAQFLPAFEVAMRHEVSPEFRLLRYKEWEKKGIFEDKETGEVAKWGITLWTLKRLKYAPAHNMTLEETLKAMKFQEISDIYRSEFWSYFKLPGTNTPCMDMVGTQIVASKWFDMAVHTGPVQAAKLLQSAVSRWCPLKNDGIIGPVTLKGINQCNAQLIVPEMCCYYREYLLDRIRLAPVNKKYKTNWMERARWPFVTDPVFGGNTAPLIRKGCGCA